MTFIHQQPNTAKNFEDPSNQINETKLKSQYYINRSIIKQ